MNHSSVLLFLTINFVSLLPIKVPFFAAIFSPSAYDPRLDGLRAKLEKNPFSYGNQEATVGNIITGNVEISKLLSSGESTSGRSIDIDSNIYPNTTGPGKMSSGKLMSQLERILSWE